MGAATSAVRTERLRIEMQGAVQGVGFRPTVYRLAMRLRVSGWVRNTSAGLEIEVEGNSDLLEQFVRLLRAERPETAVVTTERTLRVAPTGGRCFEILRTDDSASYARTGAILPDLAACPECLKEVRDPANRRFGYPFTNCTLCGPRYTIVRDIPYDRPNTTMAAFTMCSFCRREYDSHRDRRFHAQPNACPQCGPRLSVWPKSGVNTEPLGLAVEALAQGRIVALKGVGGFQLLVDAKDSAAVLRLRERKHRDQKPFALLMPSLDCVRDYCEVSPAEEKLLTSQAAPIVLLHRLDQQQRLAPEVGLSSPCLGVMLPSSPLHHLLMALYPHPLVATSGNRAGETIAIDNDQAVARLKGVADLFVLHDRVIARPCDDSVAHVLNGPQIIRRARGYAPLPLLVPRELRPVLAVGGHLKSTVAIAIGRQVFLSQHIGDLDSLESRESFQQAVDELCKFYRFEPELIVSDLHPDYASTQWAQERARCMGVPLVQVQHHHAHVASCAAENGLETDYLGVAWDGAGLGLDGAIWGGEFFRVTPRGCQRFAHLRSFALPGGEAAMRDCARPAAGLLWGTLSAEQAGRRIDPGIATLLDGGTHTQLTSSVGRLFDALAFLAGISHQNLFEGQAAMSLERAAGRTQTEECYRIVSTNGGSGDWAPLIEEMLSDIDRRTTKDVISAKFHNALANWILEVARTSGVRQVVLSGGVFQNAYLTNRALQLLRADGFSVFTHHQVPANDGGLALGQAVLAGQVQTGS